MLCRLSLRATRSPSSKPSPMSRLRRFLMNPGAITSQARRASPNRLDLPCPMPRSNAEATTCICTCESRSTRALRTRGGHACTCATRSESDQSLTSTALQEMKLRKCGPHDRPSAFAPGGRSTRKQLVPLENESKITVSDQPPIMAVPSPGSLATFRDSSNRYQYSSHSMCYLLFRRAPAAPALATRF